ncbi:hypothetical protein LCGC14_0964250 [marine sediment metagenome]|uniref:Uncharacterized protein n=1 Tax=marine sediment metagenome TaxID=412755 RepID=A0A0F9NZM4_9ZZZZ
MDPLIGQLMEYRHVIIEMAKVLTNIERELSGQPVPPTLFSAIEEETKSLLSLSEIFDETIHEGLGEDEETIEEEQSKRGNQMNTNELIALADRLDKAGRHEEADMIDQMFQKTAEEGPPQSGAPGEGLTYEEVVGHDEWLPQGSQETDEIINILKTHINEYEGNKEERINSLIMILDSIRLSLEGERKFRTGEEGLEQKSESTNVVFEKLSKVADKLDSIGATEEANLVDGFIEKHAEDFLDYQGEGDTEQSKRYDSKYHHSKQIREPKEEQKDREGRDKHHVETYQKAESTALNTRYCPEHIGVMTGRVGENTYQCPIDGKVFNSETGWTDYDGNVHPGGSVAAQTPDLTGYETSNRIFDSRENVLNAVN